MNLERLRIVLFPSLGTVHVTMMRRRGKQEVASGRYITIPISHVVLYFAVTNGHVVCMPFNWTSGIYGQIICLVIVLLKHRDVGTPLLRLQTPPCTHLWSLAAAFFSVMDLHWCSLLIRIVERSTLHALFFKLVRYQ